MSKTLTAHFTSGGIPAVSLTPTINIYQLGPATQTLIVENAGVTEVGGGWYRYNFTSYDPSNDYVFTFDGGNTLSSYERYKVGGNESYRPDIVDGVWDEQVVDHVNSGTTGMTLNQIKADTTTMLVSEATMVSYLELLLKYERNRTKIDTVNAQLIIYDNDGVTPLTTFDLRNFNNMPSVAEVCERIPV